MPTYPELENRNVIITGGAQGIGEWMVREFCAQGANVFFCDIDIERSEKLVGDTGAHFTKVDLRSEEEIQNWTGQLISLCGSGHIQTLVNNAACDPRIPLEELTTEKWDDLFAVNLRPFPILCRELSPHMNRDGHGSSIINFSSVTFHIAPAAMSAYVATKAGIQGFTRALARELGPENIRVNSLSPGWVMTERQLEDFVTDDIKEMLGERQSDPRLIQPEEIAEIALFLASDASRAITGQEILADRGQAFS